MPKLKQGCLTGEYECRMDERNPCMMGQFNTWYPFMLAVFLNLA
jgi:hypothetical protein